jgi:hypothetical protein
MSSRKRRRRRRRRRKECVRSIVGIYTYLIVHMICDEKKKIREEHLEKRDDVKER